MRKGRREGKSKTLRILRLCGEYSFAVKPRRGWIKKISPIIKLLVSWFYQRWIAAKQKIESLKYALRFLRLDTTIVLTRHEIACG
jgi:hypothetical protein